MKQFSLVNLCFAAFISVCFDGKITAQSSNQNYILTRTMQDDTGTSYSDKIDYYDGLGRRVQTVLKAASPTHKDIVTLQEYDGVGREGNAWLPTPTGGTGAYADPASLKPAAAAFYSDNAPYSHPVYEPSPLNRVTERYAPGEAWRTAARPVKTDHLTNTSSGALSCALYSIASDNSLKRNGLYAAGELFVTKNTDEDSNVSYTFTDKLGQTVMTRQMAGSLMHDTYYVYDDFGNLRYVLPPAAADALAAVATWDDANPTLKNYAYIYKYDGRNRCISKKLPGCDAITMKYDKADRLIFSQDGNQKPGTWTFFLYDVFGRQTVTGIWKSATVPATENTVVKTNYTGTGALGGYTVNLTLPVTNLLTVNYYDDYAFTNILTAAEKAKMPFVTVSGYDAQYNNVKGLLTGTRTYQLNDPAKYTVSALYYDHRGRVVQTHASNHLGGFEDEYFAYTFTGKVKQRQHVHSATGKTTQTEVYTYTYDHAERLLSVTHKLNTAAAVTLATNTYDEVGRLKTKKLATETATYNYNIRNWLTQIAGSKFNQTLTYNVPVNSVTPSANLYNGNISAMKWKSGNETAERGYKFTYDGLNRLTSAAYGEGASLAANPNRYNELITYNKMGNILTLQRQGKTDTGFGLIDNLTYNTYDGNRVTKITDAVTPGPLYAGAFHFMDGANVAVEYAYDTNGNLKKDYNKKIVDIQYNSLNLPNGLQFANGNTANYVYNAAGQKLSVTYQTAVAGVIIPMTNVMTPLTTAQISQTVKTDYCGNVVYENGAVSRILTEEGYITFSGATPVYHYYLKDHQGNNRVVLNQNGTVEQVNHYYPFGGLMGESTAGGVQPYKYNGKELDRMHGLNLFDYGARHYDAAIGRWFTVDPLAEKYYGISPYAYVANNPVNMIDPNGMWSDWVEDRQKRIYWDEQATSQATTKAGETYVGKTVYATNGDGGFRYGDQYGNWHDSAPLPEISVTGFQTSGSGPVSSAMGQAAQGYDPQWMVGFNKFVEAGLTAINLTLTATTLAAEAGSFGSGGRIRAALSTVDDAAKSGGNAFRYMTKGELKAIQETGLLRGGRVGETFWTKDLYKSAINAQNRLALPHSPTLRVEFEILNNPNLILNGNKVLPANGMMGKGSEFMTLDPVKVRLINWQPLR